MPEQADTEYSQDTPGAQSSPVDDEVTLLDWFIILAKHKRFILGVPLISAMGAAAISFLLPNIYTGTTRILPPQQSASAASALLNQLGGALGGILGTAGGASVGIRNPNDLYVGMLKSRTVADNLISRFELHKVYDEMLASVWRKRRQSRPARMELLPLRLTTRIRSAQRNSPMDMLRS